jgi:hypothetical protein
MLHASSTGGLSVEILAGQRAIDAEGGTCAFGCGDDHELDVVDDVAGDEDTRDACGFMLATLYSSVPRELTA